MKRKLMLGLLIAVLGVLFPIYKTGWGPIKAYAYHSGSESDLAANPEMSAVRSFAELSLVPVESRGLAADTARWVALDSHYTGLRDRALAADTARWTEIGKFYTDQALVADADTARWVAIGKFYSDLLLAAEPEPIVVRSYEELLANPELLSLGKFGSCGC